MAQVTYKTEKVSKKRVFYTGTDTLYEGYSLCYDWNTTTGGSISESNVNRVLRVEKPESANLDMFAGFVAAGSGGKVSGWATAGGRCAARVGGSLWARQGTGVCTGMAGW